MTAILQLKLPSEIQSLIKEFAYYSKVEAIQRKRKSFVTKQMNRCERLSIKDCYLDMYYDLFYLKIDSYQYCVYSNLIFIDHYYTVFNAVFCKECHNYASSNSYIPRSIECNCTLDMLDVD